MVAAVPLWLLTGGLRARWWKRRAIAAAGLSKDDFPSLNERATHLPIDEVTLRSLDLGPNADRIVEIFRHGQLARGVLLEHDVTETQIASHTKRMEFFVRYGWYDLHGVLREHRSDERDQGLLNHQFEPKRSDVFLVGYDLASRDHVIFYADGGARLTAPAPPVPPAATPSVARPPPTDLTSVAALLKAAHEQFDDVEALHVIADRLCELNEPRGELMALQLARKPGEPPRPEELQLLTTHAARWMPRGLHPQNLRFERGLVVEGTVIDAVEPSDLAWQTMEILRFDEIRRPNQFAPKMPRLREFRGLDCQVVVAMLPRLSKRLEVLQVCDAEYRWTEVLLKGLRAFPDLHALHLQTIRPTSDPSAVFELVLRQQLPKLTLLGLPAYLFDGLDVQRVLAKTPGFVVHLNFDSAPPEPNKARLWVEATARELTLHQVGAPHRGEVIHARELLAACGVHDPRVFTHG